VVYKIKYTETAQAMLPAFSSHIDEPFWNESNNSKWIQKSRANLFGDPGEDTEFFTLAVTV
jgi:hypothetical protein